MVFVLMLRLNVMIVTRIKDGQSSTLCKDGRFNDVEVNTLMHENTKTTSYSHKVGN